ncbi:MAG: hypothetical protein LM590_15830 [Thermofilum sp.]|nr:hypothetical protein [Thermofilum sp.]
MTYVRLSYTFEKLLKTLNYLTKDDNENFRLSQKILRAGNVALILGGVTLFGLLIYGLLTSTCNIFSHLFSLIPAWLLLLIFTLTVLHVGTLTFLWELKESLKDSVFQLASILIAVPFCTNLVPAILKLGVDVFSQSSSLAMWDQIAGFFAANLASWLLIYFKAVSLSSQESK